MMHRILIGIALFFMATTFALLFALSWQYDRHNLRTETIRQLAKEITWQSYRANKAALQVRELPELQFLARSLANRDSHAYALAKAAWKYGKLLEVWPTVPNGPALVMAVIHQESNFIYMARSFCASGPMQIHCKIWQREFDLDLSKIDDPDYNVQVGVSILKIYLEQCQGNVSDSLWLYWGRGATYAYSPKVLESKYFSIHPRGKI